VQRLRNSVLEIIHRLPMNPPKDLEPYALQIVDKLMSLINIENEDNDIVIVKTIMDFFRHQSNVVKDRVQPFLVHIQEMFQTMEQTVKDTFDHPQQAAPVPSTPASHTQYSQSPRPGSPVSTVSSDLATEAQTTRQLQKGMQSFKVLSECPIIVVSIFQSNREVVSKNVKAFVPLIKNVLLLQAKPQEEARARAKAKGEIFTGVTKDIKNRAAFGDFILMQVKTMSFLAYLLRVYAQQLTDFLPSLPDIVIRMLQDCPREKSGARKELLVAIRHIINFNFRKIFLQKIDELLDERTLIGDGLTVYETMRPLAYSMLADLIHHLRESLNKEQIRKTIEVYTKNLHDDFPGTSFQTMSAKLLMNMAECIAKIEPKEDARHFLMMLLNAIADKFRAMNFQYENIVKLEKNWKAPGLEQTPEEHKPSQDSPPEWDEIDIFNAAPIKTNNPRDRSSNPVDDNKFLFRNLISGLKNIFYMLRQTNPPNPVEENPDQSVYPSNWKEMSHGYSAEELQVFIKLFREGCRAFRYHGVEKQQQENQNLTTAELLATQHMMAGGKEEKDLLEAFATVFHNIDPAAFHEIFASEIPHLYEMCFEHSPLLHIAQFLLASEATSPAFCGMLLQFLMTKIDKVGTSNVQEASILLRLFKLSFMAVTLFASSNEAVLLPHVTKIATTAIQLSTTADEPMNYFLLLRSLFRSIGGGRFELLYKDLLPLLEMLLEVLNNLLASARKSAERDLFVELILTVPARLSNLLPHLSYLMRPLVVALGAGPELVGQGLRTLELCVDNLTADYIDPIMAPVIDQLMAGLWNHLRPAPYSHFHAHSTMRILGKLGGRNRKFLNGLPPLEYKPYTDDAPSFDIRLVGTSKDRAFPVDTGVDFAITKLQEAPKKQAEKNSEVFHKRKAFDFILAQIKLRVGLENLPEDFARLVRLQANDWLANKFDQGEDLLAFSERTKSAVKRDAQQEQLKKLLKAVMFAHSVPSLEHDAANLTLNLCRHFALLDLSRSLAQYKHDRKAFDVKSGEGALYVEPRVLAEAIAECLSSDDKPERDAAREAILTVRDTIVTIFGSKDRVDKAPFFTTMCKIFSHKCHQEEWYVKAGGTAGIKILCEEIGLSDQWLLSRHLEIARALMYVLKDMPTDIAAKVRIEAEEILLDLVRRCAKLMQKDELEKPGSRLMSLCKFTVQELAHSSPYVRTAAQKIFNIIAESVGVEVHEILTPVKDVLLQPILLKPLRALPFGIQIGYIDAINFCLKMPKTMVTFDEPLTRLLMECLALADAEDDTLTTKPLEHRNAENIVQLRVGCIKLLSTAQHSSEFNAASPGQSRQRIIAVFFKLLYSRAPAVVEAANAGLKGVLANQAKLPKDLLQSGLRPILMNLQDPRKLSVEGLEGLARLLKLLTNYFKVEIGSRLLDHSKTIAEQAIVHKISFGLVEQNRPMRVIRAILDIFHLLPPAALSFLSQLVEKVVELEQQLRRTQSSPFREPLIRYLNMFPKETWAYFAPKLRDMAYGRFFAQLLFEPDAAPLRDAVVADVEGFINAFQLGDDVDAKEKSQARINAVHVAWAICKAESTKSFIVTAESTRKALFDTAKELEKQLRDDSIDGGLRLAAEQAGDQAMDLLISFMEQETQNFDFFFEVVDSVTNKTLKNTPKLLHFIHTHMVVIDDNTFKKTLLVKCIDNYASKTSSQGTKTYLFHNVVNPLLAMDAMRNWDALFAPDARGTELVDRPLVELLQRSLWQPQAFIDPLEDTGQIGIDHARMEFLQLTAFLLKYHKDLLQDARKVIIKFCWNWIKLEDIVNRNAAYVVISYFIALYDTPSKIVISVYQTLLKAHQNEGKPLVTQALELLAPVLRQRIGNSDKQRSPFWARLPKKILAEDAGNLQQSIAIFNFFIRHEGLFYEARDMLTPMIIPQLQKIAQPPVTSNEYKKIVLNLIEMIWKWEERSFKESQDSPSASPQSQKRKADGTIVPAAPGKARVFGATAGHRSLLIKYLVNFIAFLPDQYPCLSPRIKEATKNKNHGAQSPDTCRKAVKLLHDFLETSYWSDLDLDPLFQKIEPILASEQGENQKYEMWLTRIINTLEILRVLVNVKPDAWVLDRLPIIQRCLDKPMRLDDVSVQDCLHAQEAEREGEANGLVMQPLFERVLEVIPAPVSTSQGEDEAMEESSVSDFFTLTRQVLEKAFSDNNLNSAVNLLWSICQRRQSEVDQHISSLMKAFNLKLVKDLVPVVPGQQPSTPYPGQQGPQPTTQLDPSELEISTGLVLKTIEILAARIEVLGEQRRPFLSALATLVERSQNKDVCMKVLDLAEQWIFHSDGVPTLKEKVAVLSKMFVFENRSDTSLLARFFELVIRVYEDPKVTRTELTVRLENAFLIGTRAQDVEMRNRFLTIFDKHISRSPNSRLDYLLCAQDWAWLADSFWISQINHLLVGSIEVEKPVTLHRDDFKTTSLTVLYGTYAKDSRLADVMVDDKLETFLAEHKRFSAELADVRSKDLIDPLTQLQHTDKELAKQMWVNLFPVFWAALPREDKNEFEQHLTALLSKDFHNRQFDARPNCVQALLEGIVRVGAGGSGPKIKIPPHVVKWLAKTYNCWYVAAHYLEESATNPLVDTPLVRESTLDALVELYAALEESDLFYGTWRRRCQYVETNAALSYEQIGVWDQAQKLYEQAQIKARVGSLPFSQGEYMLWEDHWVICAQKLQQWDILADFAKHENFNDLYLEATWREYESWQSPSHADKREQLDSVIKGVADAPTPRRLFFQAFMSLLKVHAKAETPADFQRVCDEAIQLSIRKWHQLPKSITNAHVPLLQSFQHLVELYDALTISSSLQQTNATNLDNKSQDLKVHLSTWRDRLPNFWDDINAWQDLVTWRQHIFFMINSVYLGLVPATQNNAASNSFAYRGYHETAWIINRFAHVARQHNLPEVCISQLGKIYTLPNIEIQEAFLKLREQAKCHYANKNELNNGLDVINNTNLNYFGQQQKAEFYTLKGMFLNKLGNKQEANDAFGSALYFDIKLAKAWAEWGNYNDQLFKEDPKNLEKASSAISCYLEASSLYKNHKSRKLLGRILWLLSLDNANRQLAKAFEEFKGDTPVWYWITYIPQLLADLSRPEAPIARQILGKLAKAYPQALFFQLRTNREDMHAIKKQQEVKEAREKQLKEQQAKKKEAEEAKKEDGTPKQGSPTSRPGTSDGQSNGAANTGEAKSEGQANGQVKTEGASDQPNGEPMDVDKPKKPWEYHDEVLAALKTAFPLLALSMEFMVDQINKHFKCHPDEDAHRLIVALLNDGLSYVGRQPNTYAQDVKLPQSTEANITRFAESVCPPHIRKSFEADFAKNKPTMYEYIQRLKKWRNRFEERLDRRTSPVALESFSPHLSEFRFQKFDDVEVPGQYLQHKDKNQDFIRIERFITDVDLVRGTQVCYRRLKIRGHDGSLHPFQVQHPAGRSGRREERILQLFRIFNEVLLKRKESRRRNLQFNLPVMVPLSPSVRMIEDDVSYVNLQGVYEDYCRKNSVDKDEPVLYTIEKLRQLSPVSSLPCLISSKLTQSQKSLEQANAIRFETFVAVQEKYVPNNIALDYFSHTYPSFSDFWLFRRAFSYQFASLTFMTYMMCMSQRYPHKLSIARGSGKVWGSELVPSMGAQRPVFNNPEVVPFRFTPNLQALMGPITTEGIFAPALMTLARCLTEREGELEMQLSIFIRDEVTFWFLQSHKGAAAADGVLREAVMHNSDVLCKKVRSLADAPKAVNLPCNQTVVDRVGDAVDPRKLSQTEPLWMSWL
jgi:transformation/transcription domain-associated protein